MNQSNQISKEQKLMTEGFVSHYGKLFLCVLTIFSVGFIVLLCCANREFQNSQMDIKHSYMEHIQKADSLYWDMVAYNKEYTFCISDANAIILTDSLVRLTLGNKQRLSSEQYGHLSEIISCYFAKVAQLHHKYDNKIQRDSLLLITERQLLEGQVKTMLDLHLNKVEHEYSNITLWAAVLTILFLVFSFYSIFKMDSLVHQGQEGVKEIKQLNKDGEIAIQEIRNKGDALINSSEEKINDLRDKASSDYSSFVNTQQQVVNETMSVINSKIEAIKKESEQAVREVTISKGKIDNISDESIKLLKDKLLGIEKKYDDALNEKVAELNEYTNQLQNIISKIEQDVRNKYQESVKRKEDKNE